MMSFFPTKKPTLFWSLVHVKTWWKLLFRKAFLCPQKTKMSCFSCLFFAVSSEIMWTWKCQLFSLMTFPPSNRTDGWELKQQKDKATGRAHLWLTSCFLFTSATEMIMKKSSVPPTERRQIGKKLFACPFIWKQHVDSSFSTSKNNKEESLQ